ncbi:MAG: hypothetical protein K8T20_09310 [Planctomycetes bacterium]|nr:hypothetical protein [Planctomycetota bacterium]
MCATTRTNPAQIRNAAAAKAIRSAANPVNLPARSCQRESGFVRSVNTRFSSMSSGRLTPARKTATSTPKNEMARRAQVSISGTRSSARIDGRSAVAPSITIEKTTSTTKIFFRTDSRTVSPDSAPIAPTGERRRPSARAARRRRI